MTESEPQNYRLGYARVRTYGQTLDRRRSPIPAGGASDTTPVDGARVGGWKHSKHSSGKDDGSFCAPRRGGEVENVAAPDTVP